MGTNDAAALIAGIRRAFIGGEAPVRLAVTALLARGHLLIEDVPGIGKTLLGVALARSIDASFKRIQFTNDLLPSDILGLSVYDARTSTFEFRPGPIFHQIILADEINRTTPKTQSALLEAMSDLRVSVDGATRPLPTPFMIIATQNPIEYHGTFPLPEAQLDRFLLRLKLGYPTREDETEIIRGEDYYERARTLEPVLSARDLLALQDKVDGVRIDPVAPGLRPRPGPGHAPRRPDQAGRQPARIAPAAPGGPGLRPDHGPRPCPARGHPGRRDPRPGPPHRHRLPLLRSRPHPRIGRRDRGHPGPGARARLTRAMRLTRLGLSVLAAASFAAFGGLIGGNNLLFLAAAIPLAALIASFFRVGGAGVGAGLDIEVGPPEQVFCDTPCRLEIRVRNRRRRLFPASAVAGPWGRAELPAIPGRGEARAEIVHLFRRRGRTAADDLVLEFERPFGLFRARRRLEGLHLTVLPRVREIQGRPESPAVRQESAFRLHRGRGGDLHGVRDYAPGEDSRAINWKLSARAVRPLVVEYAEPSGDRVTISADGTPGPGTEEAISEAASLARFFVDEGAEVRLRTNEGDVPFGRGLLHLHAILGVLALLGRGKEESRAEGRPPIKNRAEAAAGAPPSKALYVAAAAAIGSLFLVDRIPALFTALSALVLPIGWAFDKRRRHPIPRGIFDAGALAVLVLAFTVGFPRAGLIPTVSAILLYVLTAYLLAPKTPPLKRRLLLSLFLLFVLASSQAVDIGYFPVLAVFFLGLGAWLEEWLDPPSPAGSSPRGRRGLTVAAVRVFVLAALLFAVLPRAYSPRMQQLLAATGLSRFQDPRSSFAGLSDRVDLGFFGPLRKNPARAMQVRFPDAPPELRRPEVLRVRAAAFDRFVGRRWIRTPGEFTVREGNRRIKSRNGLHAVRARDGLIPLPGYDPARPAAVQELLVYPMIGSTVFAAGGIAALETGARSAAVDLNDTVTLPFLFGGPIRYRVRSSAEAPDYGRAIEGYEAVLRERFLDRGNTDDRWTAEARRMTARAESPAEKAAAMEAWLRTRFSYSLAAADNRQSLDSFLWTSQAGNCEYFASAMTLLLRHLDIPSRLVVGFLGSEWNEFGSFFDIRQSDAHAWVEAYLPERGWAVFDPTPADALDRGGRSLLAAVWGRIRRSLDALESRWYRFVVGYDPETQISLFRVLGRALSRAMVPLAGLALSAVLAVLAIRGRLFRRKKARRRVETRRGHFYYRVLDGLERRGFPKPPGQTAADWAAVVVRRRPDLADLAGLTETFYAVRYAGAELAPDAARRARESADRLLKLA